MCENQVKLKNILEKASKISSLVNKLNSLKSDLSRLEPFNFDELRFIYTDKFNDSKNSTSISIDSISIDAVKELVLNELNKQIALTTDELSALLK